MAKSVLQSERECFICGRIDNLHKHHVFYGTSNRSNSEKHGLWVYLCYEHHNGSDEGVHFNKETDMNLKCYAQGIFERNHSREEFRSIFGKSYL